MIIKVSCKKIFFRVWFYGSFNVFLLCIVLCGVVLYVEYFKIVFYWLELFFFVMWNYLRLFFIGFCEVWN